MKTSQQKSKTLYRIVMSCWDRGEREPYNDFVITLYETADAARLALRACVKEELETLNERDFDDVDIEYPSEVDDFKADFDGDEFDAIIRYWEGEDYWPVTGYKIYEVEYSLGCQWHYRSINGHCFTISGNKACNRYEVFLGDEPSLCVRDSLTAALEFVDAYILEQQTGVVEEENEWTLPVTWEVCGFVKVKGKTLADAIENFERDVDHIPLPSDSTYVDGSFQLTSYEEDFIHIYNKKKQNKEE